MRQLKASEALAISRQAAADGAFARQVRELVDAKIRKAAESGATNIVHPFADVGLVAGRKGHTEIEQAMIQHLVADGFGVKEHPSFGPNEPGWTEISW